MYCRVNTHIQSKKVIKEKHVFVHREKDYTNKRAWLLNIIKIHDCVNNIKQVVFTNMYILLFFGLYNNFYTSHLEHHKGEYWEWLLTHLDKYNLICFWFQGVFIIARDFPSHFNLTKVIEMRTKCSRIFRIDIFFLNLLVSYTNIDSHILPHIHMHTSPMNSNWILKHACWWYVQISQSFNGIWHQMLLKN